MTRAWSRCSLAPMSGDDEIKKLTGLAVEARANFIEAALNVRNISNWLQDQTDAYMAWAGDKWTDEGLAAWVAARQGEMNAAWRTDVASVTDDTPAPTAVETPPASAIREAGEALKRCDERDEPLEDPHMRVLFAAVISMRGLFMQRLEREMASLRPGEDPNEHMAQHRNELRALFRRDCDAAIKEARGR
jgi:hypothetical protein